MTAITDEVNFVEKLFLGARDLLDTDPVLGFGLAIFVLVSLILLFSVTLRSNLDAGMRSQINRFLYLGVFCFSISVVSSMVEKFYGAKYEVKLFLSPNFDVVNLPLPKISGAQHNADLGQYILTISKNETVQIGFDETIKAIEASQLSSLKKDEKIAALSTALDEQVIGFEAVAAVATELTLKTEAEKSLTCKA